MLSTHKSQKLESINRTEKNYHQQKHFLLELWLLESTSVPTCNTLKIAFLMLHMSCCYVGLGFFVKWLFLDTPCCVPCFNNWNPLRTSWQEFY
ncbi:hypothetical protein K7X08_026229 [Anisodus acutangulus]|uniref:Uncharacterized protein n=1 Tax=Anisodus acutangulus TaxID=402998 RepID=A0A9Q1N2B6_9SOLA|nr:hypothetical protein K7X08_026229 [Anisodus acutangulus]